MMNNVKFELLLHPNLHDDNTAQTTDTITVRSVLDEKNRPASIRGSGKWTDGGRAGEWGDSNVDDSWEW